MNSKNVLNINKLDGSLTIKNFPITMKKGSTKDEVSKILTSLYRSNIDHKNGKEWLFFEDLIFSDCPCTLGLFFERNVLVQVKIAIKPTHSDRSKSGWSSDESVNEAVLLALIEFKIALARPFKEGREMFDWGEVWCVPDLKRSEMDAGIRYA